jgi:hypothetical protein
MKKYLIPFFFILFFSCLQLTAQEKLSHKASVSVITCGPGNDLYSAYGHSAFRIYDPILNLDKIYNYGTFDFEAPNFYLNFAKGKLTYLLSTSSFSNFLRIYRYENRWVKAQKLNLNPDEVQGVFDFLENNARPENRSYQYDFFYDNCATKIEDVINIVLTDKVSFPNDHVTTKKSHRDLIADYTSDFKWGKFGIDLALGAVIDDEATKDDYKFLPDYIFEAFENATISSGNSIEPLVTSVTEILKEKKPHVAQFSIFSSPLIFFLIIALLISFITYKNFKNQKRTKWLDFLLYLSTGLIGVVVLLLWFATSHTATYSNYNFLWAFAPNLAVAFIMFKSTLPKWVQYYNKLLLVLLLIMVIFWVLKIQVFNVSMIPIILALIARYSLLISIKER